MRPVCLFLLCLAVGVQCLVQAAPGLSGDGLDEGIRSDSAASSWEHGLRRDKPKQKWIQQVQEYARMQMALGSNLLSPFRLDLPIDGEEPLPVLVLPVPVGGSVQQGINYQQDNKDSYTNANFNGYQGYPDSSNNYDASPNQVHNYYHNNIFLNVAGPPQKVQPPINTVLEQKDNTVQKFASPSLSAANNVPKYPPGLRDDDDYVPPLPTRPPPPPTPQGFDVRNQSNANLTQSQSSPNFNGNYSPPLFYFPSMTTRTPESRPYFITPLKKTENSDPPNKNSGDALSADVEAAILSVFSPKGSIPSSESLPSFTSLIAPTTNIGTNATSSPDPNDSKALTNGTSPPQPLPLHPVPPTVENDNVDDDDFIPPRFFANDGI